MKTRLPRKLTAILYADVAGYSRLLRVKYVLEGNIRKAGQKAEKAASAFVETAQALIDASGADQPKSWADFVAVRYPFKRGEDSAHLTDGLHKAGLS